MARALSLGLGLAFVARSVSAQAPPEELDEPTLEAPREESAAERRAEERPLEPGEEATGPAEERTVGWREGEWSRFQWWEGLVSAGLLGVGATFVVFVAPEARWTGDGGPLDAAVSDAFHIEGDRAAFESWGLAADVAYFSSFAYPAVDALLSAGLVHGDWDLALQMLLMNLEAYAAASATFGLLQFIGGRERPYVDRQCVDDASVLHGPCAGGGAVNRSFPGGHVMIASTAAALTCTHHAHSPLFGHPAADWGFCGLTIAGAATAFVGRLVQSKHHLSDQILGSSLGALLGYLVPALHYDVFGGGPANEDEPEGTEAYWVPTAGPTRGGEGFQGGVTGLF